MHNKIPGLSEFSRTRTYISELIYSEDTNGRYSLRSNNGILVNFANLLVSALKLWNELPLPFFSVKSFKKSLKTHLFENAFIS